MIQSKNLVTASAILSLAAVALAATPCGWPKTPTIGGGGQCKDPLLGGPYCTQTELIEDGGCKGSNNTKTCLDGPRVQEYPYYILRVPNSGCNVTDPCVSHPTQVQQVTYTHAVQTTDNCVKPAEPIEPIEPTGS